MSTRPSGFDFPPIALRRPPTDGWPLMFLTDPATAPTGFGRVGRELVTGIAAADPRWRLAYLSRGWAGTTRMAGIATYSDGNRAGECQDALPMAAEDFAGHGPMLLWTLLDPWQVGWLSSPKDRRATATSNWWLQRERKRLGWIAYFPMDGTGPTSKEPPLYTADYLHGADVLVAMSRWGRDLVAPALQREVHFIPHAVKTDVFRPPTAIEKVAARTQIDGAFRVGMARGLAAGYGAAQERPSQAAFAEEVERRRFRLSDRFVVLCVMANRARKYWWDALQAFAGLVAVRPDARLIAVCGDRTGIAPDSWPLEELCKRLKLRLEETDDDPNVTLIETLADRPEMPDDHSMAQLLWASDLALLLGGGEGSGLPQLEAHACGIPCLVGDYSASSEQAVADREKVLPRGYYITAGNMVRRPIYRAQDFTDRLAWAAANPKWIAETGAAGRAHVLAHHDWRVVLPQWLELLQGAWTTLGERLQAGTAAPAR